MEVEVEVAEVGAPRRKKVHRLLLRNPQVNSSFSSCPLVPHFAPSLRQVPQVPSVPYVATDNIFFEYSQVYESLNSVTCQLAPFTLRVHYRKVDKHT